jgi:RNA polymerase sigma-70 factor (ECF subfamily)
VSFELEPLADPAVSELTVQLPAAFWAFHRQYYGAYREYARLQLGDAHSGSQLAHRVFMHLAMNWAGLMEEGEPGRLRVGTPHMRPSPRNWSSRAARRR